ncbi:LysM peptidoglycan-binding domain-containing protein [Sphingobacterium sp. UT-1RO-CII-1]|uniref:LysM peptidoglycan-binding domain-containing protein n=1 Tax=Sphingobacterium sp. UT-1RO-CII-1 TaxID=2995225 RepID=UPI00227D3EBC|nr:LysM peptidoglycan-binding domain-containing protein [Sphingobacterium sp. UT-1RO-CII-1]MCY4779461.1 LysM peptidoglycan-binding domain-containing protein [Sphingobacterium sp. UT-1RO-CII-1]
MINSNKISTYIKLGLIGILYTPFSQIAIAASNLTTPITSYTLAPDSIGTEVIKGEVYILHRVEAKETYYALGRKYKAQVNQIMANNNKKTLRPGDIIKIPTGKKANTETIVATEITPSTTVAPTATPQEDQNPILTAYKVGNGETLYAISRRFNTSVDEIKKLNKLTSDSVREGQMLNIPNSDYHEPEPEIITPEPVATPVTVIEEPQRALGFDSNRYGIREKQEKGIGVWMENLETDGKSNLALHKTAPVGTILKITNPMTKNVTYAKVVGKFNETADTQDAIVILSKSAASYIGALDRRFLIEITYGLPIE